MKKITALALSGCLLLSSAFTAYAQEQKDTFPNIYFEYCAIKPLSGSTGPDGHPYRILDNDLFYIQYPGTWSFGTSDLCPIVFFNDSEVETTSYDFQDFQDSALIGSEDEIDRYIQSGGIDSYLKQVLKVLFLSVFTYLTHNKSDTILVYNFEKGGTTIASVIVWTSFGKLSIRDERSTASFDPTRDYGDIMVFPVWDTEDFSSTEAIKSFVDSGKLNAYLDPCEGPVTWSSIQTYDTSNHQYLLCEGTSEDLNVSVYIPVVGAGMKKWIVGFDVYKESQIDASAYGMQADIISTFQVLK